MVGRRLRWRWWGQRCSCWDRAHGVRTGRSPDGDGHGLARDDRGAGGQGLRRRRSSASSTRRASTSTTPSEARCAPRATRSARRSRTRARASRVKAQIAETTEGEALAAEVAANGLAEGGQGQGRGRTCPGNVVIQRAYTFTNYAGPLPLRRGAQQAARRHDRPGDVVHVHGPERHVAGLQPVQQHDQPGRRRRRRSAATRSPTATPAPARGTCTTAAWSRCAAPTRTCRPAEVTRARRATPTATSTPAASTEWTGKALPPRVAGFQKDFITKYMDPTETYNRMDSLDARSSRTSCRRSTCRTRPTATAVRRWR